MIMIDELVLIH